MKKTLTTLLTTAALVVTIEAQDFFNGMPGPRGTQIDNYISVDNQTGKTSGMVIPKLFFGNMKDSYANVIAVLPTAITEKGDIKLNGANVGAYDAIYSGKSASVHGMAAAGMFKGSSDQLENFVPQLYVTGLAQGISADIQGSMAFNLKDASKSKSAAMTLGYGNNMVRAGGSVKFQDGKKPLHEANLRVDLTKDHQYWLQGYISKQRAGVRFAANF